MPHGVAGHLERAVGGPASAGGGRPEEEGGTFPTPYDLTARFKGRGGEVVPATTVQTLADRLSTALKRYRQLKDLGVPCGLPRFTTPNRGPSIPLRQ